MRFIDSLLPAHFTRMNRIIFFLAILLSIVSLIALLKIAPTDEAQSRKMLATLVGVEQYVTRKFSNSLSFNQIGKGEKLFNGDSIFTGEKSSAKIIFTQSGNVLNIPPQGLVKIEEGSGGENVEIQKGLAEFVIQKDQTLNIVKGAETLTLTPKTNENGSGKIYFNNDKIILQVDSGQIKLASTKGPSQEIKKNETASVTEGDVVKVETVMLVSPAWNARVDVWKGIDLAWNNKGPIEVTLSKKSDFSEIVGKMKVAKSPYTWVLPLEVGQYFLKVKGAAKNAAVEPVIPLEMHSPHVISDFSPANNAVVNLKRGDGLQLRWSAVPADKYKVTVVGMEGRTAIYSTTNASIQLQKIKGSSLSWSVAPVLKSGAMLADSEKNTIKLTYEGENKILSPKVDQNFYFNKDRILLSWSALAEERQQIRISDMDAKQEIVKKDIQGERFEFIPPSPGHYLFELASKDYPSSSPVSTSFMVTSKVAEWVTKDVSLESIDEEEKKVELRFDSINRKLEELTLEIYSDPALKNKTRSSQVLSSTINFTVKKFGTSCFVIRPVVKTSFWLSSPAQCITYKELPPFDKAPTASTVIMKYIKINGVDGYSIELPMLSRAEFYEFQVYGDNQAKKMVFTDKSRGNVIKWPTNKTGIYYYRYRVIDSKNRNSAFSNMAKLIFPISPLTDLQE